MIGRRTATTLPLTIYRGVPTPTTITESAPDDLAADVQPRSKIEGQMPDTAQNRAASTARCQRSRPTTPQRREPEYAQATTLPTRRQEYSAQTGYLGGVLDAGHRHHAAGNSTTQLIGRSNGLILSGLIPRAHHSPSMIPPWLRRAGSSSCFSSSSPSSVISMATSSTGRPLAYAALAISAAFV